MAYSFYRQTTRLARSARFLRYLSEPFSTHSHSLGSKILLIGLIWVFYNRSEFGVISELSILCLSAGMVKSKRER